MKKLNALNLGKSLNRAEMKNIAGGIGEPGKPVGRKCSFTINGQYYSGVNESVMLDLCSSYDCQSVSCN